MSIHPEVITPLEAIGLLMICVPVAVLLISAGFYAIRDGHGWAVAALAWFTIGVLLLSGLGSR